jgi:hypothetical protein
MTIRWGKDQEEPNDDEDEDIGDTENEKDIEDLGNKKW